MPIWFRLMWAFLQDLLGKTENIAIIVLCMVVVGLIGLWRMTWLAWKEERIERLKELKEGRVLADSMKEVIRALEAPPRRR